MRTIMLWRAQRFRPLFLAVSAELDPRLLDFYVLSLFWNPDSMMLSEILPDWRRFRMLSTLSFGVSRFRQI